MERGNIDGKWSTIIKGEEKTQTLKAMPIYRSRAYATDVCKTMYRLELEYKRMGRQYIDKKDGERRICC